MNPRKGSGLAEKHVKIVGKSKRTLETPALGQILTQFSAGGKPFLGLAGQGPP